MKKEKIHFSENLPPLPFIYQEVKERENADYVIEAKDEKEAFQKVKEIHEKLKWYTSEYWRKKGIPYEQWRIKINDKKIIIYNFNKETPLSQTHIEIIQKSIEAISQKFPKVLDLLNFILIDDFQRPSLYDNEEKFPLNGIKEDQHTFSISPRGMRLDIPHRISSISNFQGTLIHEMGHFIDLMLIEDWVEISSRKSYADDPEWEEREIGGKKKWVNKKTGEVAPSLDYPLEPQKFVSEYAKLNMQEDICDSIVAYIYEPEKLKKIAPEKYEILKSYDNSIKEEKAKKYKVEIEKEKEVKLPEIQPEVITYYIEKNRT